MNLLKAHTNHLKKWVELERWTKSRRKEFVDELNAGQFTYQEACLALRMSDKEMNTWIEEAKESA